MDSDVSLASRLGWETLVHYENVGPHRIAVASEGSKDAAKPALLLIHGFPTCAWDWHKLWPLLRGRYTLIAPDLLGFGLSDKPASYQYTVAEQADICEAVLNKLGVTRCSIIAHDCGDTVAQELLARLSQDALSAEIDRVIMLNGGILPAAHRPLTLQKLLAGPLGPMMDKLLTKKRFKKSFAQIFGPSTQPVGAEFNMLWDFITHNDGHRRSHALLAYMEERRRFADRWEPTVLAPARPMLMINGALDPISGAHMMDAYTQRGGTARVLSMETIGHYPQLEAAQETAAAIREFLA